MSPRVGTLVVGLAAHVAAVAILLLTGYLVSEYSLWWIFMIYPAIAAGAISWVSFELRGKEY